MAGRRWADGLHQAVEAKEGVQVKGETQTFATITIQNYFRMYDKLAGMTGTAETEETEFYQIYGLEVNVIPTHRPITPARPARPDLQDPEGEVRRDHGRGRAAAQARLAGPDRHGERGCLGDAVASMLKRRGLKHEVLNAKYHQREAEIVARRGPEGRDHDRDQHGRPRHRHQTRARTLGPRRSCARGRASRSSAPSGTSRAASTASCAAARAARAIRAQSHLLPLARRRPDAALRLATASPGGWTRAGPRRARSSPAGLVTRAIEQAQKRVELQNFQQRKRLLEYDDVMNQQREVVYSLRLFALERGEELKAEARRMIDGGAGAAVRKFLAARRQPEECDRGGSARGAPAPVPGHRRCQSRCRRRRPTMDELVRRRPRQRARRPSSGRSSTSRDFGSSIGVREVDGQVLSQVMLNVLDEKWKDHLYDLDQLRNAIQYRAWGQKDPLVEYKQEAFEMFEDLMRDIQSTFTERYLKIQVSAEPPAAAAPGPPSTAACTAHRRRSRADDLFAAPSRRRLAPPPPAATAVDARWAGGAPQRPCPRWGGTIRARAGRGRSTRSATGRGNQRRSPVVPRVPVNPADSPRGASHR